MTSPYLPTDILHGWGRQRPGRATSGRRRNDVYAHNDALQFSDKLTKLAGTHGLKFGISVERGQKQQNFQNLEAGQLWFGTDNGTGTGNSGADMLVGRVGSFTQGTARNGNPAPGEPSGEWRYWNFDAFAQDSWKLRSNLTLEYGVRFGMLDEQRRADRPRRLLHADAVRPDQGLVPRSGHVPAAQRRLLRLQRTARRTASSRTVRRSRCRASTSRGTSTATATTCSAAATGMFYNRNMGNVEYDNTLRLAAQRLSGRHRLLGRRRLRQRPRPDLRHRSARRRWRTASAASAINTLTPDSFMWPKTHSFSVSYARRIPWNQVVEVSYVGTRGRDLVSRSNGNVMPYGALSTGTFNGVDLSGAGQPRRGGERRRPTWRRSGRSTR